LNKYKIYVYAICKNEEQFADRWMDAVGEADGVIVTDTGSEDRTVQKLRARGAVVYEEKISPWRFDVARTISLNHVPEDADICVCNDLDEVFEPGWREKLEAVWKPEHTRAKYLFTWSFNPDGTPLKQFPMEKIHRRHGFRWIHPVHELLEYSGEDPESIVWVDGLVLNHYPDLTKPRSQYLPLLELSAKENPLDDRTVFWLGREYMYYGKYDESIATLQQHLRLPTALWAEERSASMRFIARCYEAKGDYAQAKSWLWRAMAEYSAAREPYLAMAKIGYLEKDWPLTYAMIKKALNIVQPSGSYLVDPESWGAMPYDYGAISAFRLGLPEEALMFAKTACEQNPEDKRLQANLQLIEQALAKQESKEGD
jgi:tetratricopeptide (TPR) repeat protein